MHPPALSASPTSDSAPPVADETGEVLPRHGVTRHLPLAAFLILFGLFFAGQGVRPLTDTSEGRYAEVAREMLTSGNWMVPTLEGLPHLTKPPLATWLMAGSMAVFGQNDFAVRLPGWIALFLTAALVWRIAAALGRPEASAWAGFIYLLSLGPLVASTFPTTDTILTFFEVGAATAYLVHRSGSSRARWFFFLALGAAFLTKGPPGLLVPAAVIIGDRLLRRDRPASPSVALLSFWPGWLLFLAVGMGWYLSLVLRHPGLISYWLRDETLYRVFSDHHHRSSHPTLPTLALLGGLLPWWPLLARSVWKERTRFASCWRRGARPVLLAWIVLPLAVFTASQSRLALYALPLVPAAALALALDRPRSWGAVPGRWFRLHPGLVIGYGAFLAALSVASLPVAARQSWRDEARWMADHLPDGPIELVTFRSERVNSLQFYLATTAEILWIGEESPDPRFDSLNDEVMQMRVTEEGGVWHLFVAKGSEGDTLFANLAPPPVQLRTVGRYQLWLQGPWHSPDQTDAQEKEGGARFVYYGPFHPAALGK